MEKIFKNDDTKTQLQRLINELMLDEMKKSQEEQKNHIISSLDNTEIMNDVNQKVMAINNQIFEGLEDLDELISEVNLISEKQNTIEKKQGESKKELTCICNNLNENKNDIEMLINKLNCEVIELSDLIKLENEVQKKTLITCKILSVASLIGVGGLILLNVIQLFY